MKTARRSTRIVTFSALRRSVQVLPPPRRQLGQPSKFLTDSPAQVSAGESSANGAAKQLFVPLRSNYSGSQNDSRAPRSDVSMLFPSYSAKKLFTIPCFIFAAFFGSQWFAVPSSGQQIVHQGQTVVDPETAKPDVDKAKLVASGPAEPPPVLQQLNSAIEQLTARISPAVVQILVTGYGPLEENNRGQTALITREHGIG